VFARDRLIKGALRRRFVVTLKGAEGDFAGVLTEFDRRVMIFEQCTTVPSNTKEQTPTDIPGRIIVERSSVAYLQEWWWARDSG